MIRLVRTVQTRHPKAAVDLATEFINHFKAKHSQRSIEVFVDRFADAGRRLHWHIDFEDLAHFEKWQAEIANDADYAKLLNKAQEIGAFVDNTMVDTIQHDLTAAAKLALH